MSLKKMMANVTQMKPESLLEISKKFLEKNKIEDLVKKNFQQDEQYAQLHVLNRFCE